MMANRTVFQIAQGSGKENPCNMYLKENPIDGGKSLFLQPLCSSKQECAYFAVVNSKAHARAQLRVNSVIATNKNHKVVLRDIGNVRGNSNNNNKHDTSLASVVVIQKQNSTVAAAATYQLDVVDKENVYYDKQKQQYHHQQQQHITTDSSEVFKFKENENLFDATPMSVSELLSPMSVDCSASVSQLFDDGNSMEIVEQSEYGVKPLPHNERHRFFEVVEYQRSILEYFRQSENKKRPNPHYMRHQTDINYSMRTILVDWLVEVSEEYDLDTETLYLSVSYIDRFLSQMSVLGNDLQLVGTTAMYIAAKYEEIYLPGVDEFVSITDGTYNKAQVLRMEQIMLKTLAFDLCIPTAYDFINTYSVLIDIPDKVKFLTLYIAELSLLEADPYLSFHPSNTSAAALALARYLCNLPIWCPELEEITAYSLNDLDEVFLYLCKTHNTAAALPQQAIHTKYRAENYCQVSTIIPQEISKEQFDQIVKHYQQLS